MVDRSVRDWEAVRLRLVGNAQRAGLPRDVAEDLAQEAIIATLSAPGVEHPVSYALVTLQTRIAAYRRARSSMDRNSATWLLQTWKAPLIPSLELLSIASAIEQLAIWGSSGRTYLRLSPGDDIDRRAAGAARSWERLLGLLDETPVGGRQRRRYRIRAAEILRSTIESGRAGVQFFTPGDRPAVEIGKTWLVGDSLGEQEADCGAVGYAVAEGTDEEENSADESADGPVWRVGRMQVLDDPELFRLQRLADRIRTGR